MSKVGYVQGWTCPGLDMSRVEYVQGWICPGLDMSRVGYVQGWICPGLDVWKVVEVHIKFKTIFETQDVRISN